MRQDKIVDIKTSSQLFFLANSNILTKDSR